MTSEDFDKGLKEQNITMETLARRGAEDLAITKLQDNTAGRSVSAIKKSKISTPTIDSSL